MLVVFEETTEEVIDLPLTETRFLGDLVLSMTDTVQAVASRTDENVAIGDLLKGIHAWMGLVGERISYETVTVVVVSCQTGTASHPEPSLIIAQYLYHLIVNDGGGVVLIMDIGGEPVPVEFIQTIFRTDP